MQPSLFLSFLSGLSRESDGEAVLSTNPHQLKSYLGFKFSSCCLKSCPDNLLLVVVPPSRYKHRKASYPRVLQQDEDGG